MSQEMLYAAFALVLDMVRASWEELQLLAARVESATLVAAAGLMVATVAVPARLLLSRLARRRPSLLFRRRRRLSAATRCPVCRCPAMGTWVTCPRCETPHHADCVDYAGTCATFGCGYPGAPAVPRSRRRGRRMPDL